MASKRRSRGAKRRAKPGPTRYQMIRLGKSLNRARRAHDMVRREGNRLKQSIVVRDRRIRELQLKLRRARRR
ncbi:MAG: hypothetical protein E6L00_05850 [Thaumarchaeota archaeon]|nr:MAG: hypothetical protein E6L02_03630 [Nitrososphaerota archaeon]TLX81683.1 MAG: hypothetical protein E6L00_05850 [Nitrososphaerota archaeon]